MPRFIFCACLALCALTASSQESNKLHVSIKELPPEAFPAGICKESYSGYLEVQDHGKVKDVHFTSQQVGDYVKKAP